MVLPLAWIIGVGVVGLIGAISVTGYKQYQKYTGKKIAVLGARGVGKTSFFTFLEKGEISEQHEQTYCKQKKEGIFIKLDDKKIIFGSTYDVGGKDYGSWLDLIQVSDIIVYMMDINRVLKKDTLYIMTVREDLSKIAEQIREQEQKKGNKLNVILMLNHADEYQLYYSSFMEFEKKTLHNALVNEVILMLGGTTKCQVIIGSLKTPDEAKKLVKQLIDKVI